LESIPGLLTSLIIRALAGRYDNHILTRFLAPIDCSKILAQGISFRCRGGTDFVCQGGNFGLAIAGPSLCGSGGAFRGSGRHSEGSRACRCCGAFTEPGGIQGFWGHSVAQGHSEISKYVYIVGLRRIQGIRKYIQGSRGMFRVFKGKGLKEF
jgi:hypothetical protein